MKNTKQWYAVINKNTGEAVSFGTDVASQEELAKRGLISIPLFHRLCPACTVAGYGGNHDVDAPREGERWDPKERAVVPEPKPTIISP